MRGTGFYLAQGYKWGEWWRRRGDPVAYFIVKRAVGSFLHCALLLLVADLDGHNRADVLAHQLAGLDDSYCDLQHKARVRPGPGSSLAQEELGGWQGGPSLT